MGAGSIPALLAPKSVGKMKADKLGQEISQQPLKRVFATSGLHLPPRADELMDNNRPGRLPEIKVPHTGTGLVAVFPDDEAAHSIQFVDQNLVNAALRTRA